MKTGIAFVLVLCSCLSGKPNEKYPFIYGNWTLKNEDNFNYGELLFNKDSSAIFSSRGDTLYRFRFYVVENHIVLKTMEGITEKYKILKLDRNELILNSLREKKSIQYYSKR